MSKGFPGDVPAAAGGDQSQRPDVKGTDEATMILPVGEDAQRPCCRGADVATFEAGRSSRRSRLALKSAHVSFYRWKSGVVICWSRQIRLHYWLRLSTSRKKTYLQFNAQTVSGIADTRNI